MQHTYTILFFFFEFLYFLSVNDTEVFEAVSEKKVTGHSYRNWFNEKINCEKKDFGKR